MLNECMLSWTNCHPHSGFAVAWRSEKVDTGCHFYRWTLRRLLPRVGQHSRQGHPCCSVLSEIPFQTHRVAHSLPAWNDLCPLLMQLAVLKGLKTGRKQWQSAHSMPLTLSPGHRALILQTPPTAALWMSQLPWGLGDLCELPARGWQKAGIAHSSVPPLFHP